MHAPPKLFDAGRIAAHVARRAPGVDFVTSLALDDLGERLLAVNRAFTQAAILSPLPAIMPAELHTGGGLVPATSFGTLPGTLGSVDPEALHLPRADYDLIVSLFDLGRVNDVPGFLARIRAHLRADGLFIAATPGGDTLSELRAAFLVADSELSGGAFTRVAPMLQLADAGPLLQRAGFALPVVDIESHVVRYSSALALMSDLKALGATNPLAEPPRRFATRTLLAAASEAYAEQFADPDGRVRASLEIVWLSGWAPHDSQQKPLRPGSARVSLADVLGRHPS